MSQDRKFTLRLNSISFQKKIMFILTACLLGIALIVFLYPEYWIFNVSVKTQREAFRTPPSFIFIPTFSHYLDLFTEANFLKYFINSVVITFGATIIALTLGVPAAYALSRGQIPHKNKILFGILSSRMVPPMLFVVPFYILYLKLGLIDTWIGLIIVYLSFDLALVVWSVRAFFDKLPLELEEAAQIDGASDLQTFLKIALPLASPGIAATGVLCMVLSWNEFVFALMLTRKEATTATVAVVTFASQEAMDWGMVAAGSLVLSLPVLFFGIVVRKYLIVGLLGGALKE